MWIKWFFFSVESKELLTIKHLDDFELCGFSQWIRNKTNGMERVELAPTFYSHVKYHRRLTCAGGVCRCLKKMFSYIRLRDLVRIHVVLSWCMKLYKVVTWATNVAFVHGDNSIKLIIISEKLYRSNVSMNIYNIEYERPIHALFCYQLNIVQEHKQTNTMNIVVITGI